MNFVDEVKIFVKAGDGGRGCVSFRREKYVPRGGPDGGDGGRGGHVIFKATASLTTLIDLRYHAEYRAKKGGHGMGKNMHGRDAEDLVIPVPVGTVIRDAETNEVIVDLAADGMEAILARGGRGGLGNAHFATPVRRAPRFAQPGEKGEERRLKLELKLLADVGLVGLPNAGKSTLLAAVSSARPKIADYPFTTLSPVLGVVKLPDFRSFVVADIPGLIEGAHRGAGLGSQFLRHVERTALLLHLVDVSQSAPGDPIAQFETVSREIALYSPLLVEKPRIVIGTKIDISGDGERSERLAHYCRDRHIDYVRVSAVTGEGIDRMVSHVAAFLDRARGRAGAA